MHLYLFRHGIAIDRDAPDCPPDPERGLTERGVRRTRRAARGLRQLKVRPDLVLCSPYLRARQTAEIAMQVLDLAPMRLTIRDDLLPFAAPESLLADLPQHYEHDLLVVGHAPHLDALLAASIQHGDPGLTRLSKAGAACVTFQTPDCRQATLDWLLPARVLRGLTRKV
jgi:phosphohistidine phosphatase